MPTYHDHQRRYIIQYDLQLFPRSSRHPAPAQEWTPLAGFHGSCSAMKLSKTDHFRASCAIENVVLPSFPVKAAAGETSDGTITMGVRC